MMLSGTPSRASSRACAWRSWCGAKRRLTPARAASRRNSADGGARPRSPAGRAVDDAEQRPDRQLGAGVQPRPQLLPAPVVHADLAAAAALAVADQQRSAPLVEIVLGERERLLDAQPGAPQHDDHRSHAPAVTVIAGVAHDRDDLLHRGRVGRVAHPLVARRAPGVVARHRRDPAHPQQLGPPPPTTRRPPPPDAGRPPPHTTKARGGSRRPELVQLGSRVRRPALSLMPGISCRTRRATAQAVRSALAAAAAEPQAGGGPV